MVCGWNKHNDTLFPVYLKSHLARTLRGIKSEWEMTFPGMDDIMSNCVDLIWQKDDIMFI